MVALNDWSSVVKVALPTIAGDHRSGEWGQAMYDGVTMYESGLADVYDLVYRGRGKDYAAEAADVATLIRSKRPEAASLLDVACGTGLHLHGFGAQFEERAG